MIEFLNDSSEEPLVKFKDLYNKALKLKQSHIEAICVSSFSRDSKEVNSRMVNLKLIDNNSFIFFSNYLSPKAKEFQSHNQISVVIFWDKINLQIRLKASINRLPIEENRIYFKNRSLKKNALAISSNQSSKIDTYEMVEHNYNKTLENNNLKKCPDYWGGFIFTPVYFEFWQGHPNRINKREVYEKNLQNRWDFYYLQP